MGNRKKTVLTRALLALGLLALCAGLAACSSSGGGSSNGSSNGNSNGNSADPAGNTIVSGATQCIYDVFPINSPDKSKSGANFTLDEFPDKKFIVTSQGVFNSDDGCFMEGPIESLYVADVNGDGKRDLCVTRKVKTGDGDIHYVLGVYDQANSCGYELEEWGANQHFLFISGEKLCVGRYNQKTVNITAAGPLVVKDGALSFEEDANCISVAKNYFEHSAAAVDVFGYDRSIETLRDLFPHYFALDTSKGLTVFSNYTAPPKKYGIIAGMEGDLELEEYYKIFREYNKGRITPADIEKILDSYGLPDEQIVFRPLHDPDSIDVSEEDAIEFIKKYAYLNTRLTRYRFGEVLRLVVSDSKAGSSSKTQASEVMRQALIDDWQSWMAKTEMERAISSKMPGSCWKYFKTWAEAVDYLGFEPWNPLETADWLEKMNYAGADVVLPGDPGLMHINLSWSGENAGADTKVDYYALTAGYADGKVRVVIQISSDVYSTGEPQRTDRHTDNYDAADLEFSRDSLQYRVTVTSFEGAGARDSTYDKVFKALFNQ